MSEFTGERVVPGQVDVDLWNEHRARYLFAARLARRKRVLDIGCGTGYGAASLAGSASLVVGLDSAEEAILYSKNYSSVESCLFLQGSARALPFRDGSFDLILAFEIIEHLSDWRPLLAESRRLLVPDGQLIVSTPNKHFYAESRRLTGPNPFHEHEFDFAEFRRELTLVFPYVSVFLQNHGPGIVFRPADEPTGAEVLLEGDPAVPDDSNFFVAVCALEPQTGSPAFVHVPSAGNVLRERSQHILKLEQELATKERWLEDARAAHLELLEKHRLLGVELEERAQWAARLDAQLEEVRAGLDELHRSNARREIEIAATCSSYETKIAALERECEAQARWAMETQQQLNHSVEVLHETERTLAERTAWAQRLDSELESCKARIALVEASRWVRLGRAFGVGPAARQE